VSVLTAVPLRRHFSATFRFEKGETAADEWEFRVQRANETPEQRWRRRVHHFFYGGDEWKDGDTNRGFVRRFNALFAAYRLGREWYVGIEMATSIALGIINGLVPDDGDCKAVMLAALIVLILNSVCLVSLRPFVTQYDGLGAVILSLSISSASTFIYLGQFDTFAPLALIGPRMLLGIMWFDTSKNILDALLTLYDFFILSGDEAGEVSKSSSEGDKPTGGRDFMTLYEREERRLAAARAAEENASGGSAPLLASIPKEAAVAAFIDDAETSQRLRQRVNDAFGILVPPPNATAPLAEHSASAKALLLDSSDDAATSSSGAGSGGGVLSAATLSGSGGHEMAGGAAAMSALPPSNPLASARPKRALLVSLEDSPPGSGPDDAAVAAAPSLAAGGRCRGTSPAAPSAKRSGGSAAGSVANTAKSAAAELLSAPVSLAKTAWEDLDSAAWDQEPKPADASQPPPSLSNPLPPPKAPTAAAVSAVAPQHRHLPLPPSQQQQPLVVTSLASLARGPKKKLVASRSRRAASEQPRRGGPSPQIDDDL
jgi:hypothetical protein